MFQAYKFKKKKSIERHRAIFLTLVMVSLTLFLVGSVSAAWEWDNIKSYDKENREVTITNALGLGEDISKIKLNTPNVFYVIRGEDRLVAEFTIENYDTYSDVFNDMEFYNIKSGMQGFEREFTYKYKEFYEVEVIDYEIICKERLTINGSIEKYNCHKEEIGEHTEQKFKWKVLNKNADLEKGNITIGIFTDVYANEIVEWIPTLYGVKIDEWSVWTESLNVGLVNYYTFNETSGTTAVDSIGNNNITFTGALWNATGVIGGKITFDNVNTGQTVSNVSSLLTGANARTFNFWGSMSNAVTTNFMLSYGGAGTQKAYSFGHTVANEYLEYAPASEVYAQVNLNLVKMYTLIYDGTRTLIYVNGTLTVNRTIALDTTSNKLRIGAKFDDNQKMNSGSSMDELGMWNRTLTSAEVTQLYNDGNGITYISVFDNPPTVTLNFPTNNSNFTVNSVVFNCSSVDDDILPTDSILNVSLLIDGVINFTLLNSTASQQNISLEKNITSISDGNYNWTCTSADSNNNVGTTVTRFFTVDVFAPEINVTDPRGIIKYHILGTNLTLNWTVSDLNLDSCWFIYNETNISVTCSDNSTQFNITEYSNRNLTFYANDTFGHINNSFINWDYYIFENSQDFNDETIEGSIETFILNITKLSSITIAAINLNYNGTNNLATFSDGNNILATIDQTIPGVIGKTNFTFYWQILLSNASIINSFNNTQLVKNISIDDCSTFTTMIYNYTIVDEEEQTLLSGADLEVEINLEVFSFDRSALILNYSQDINGTNPVSICLSLSLNTSEYQTDTILKYTKGGYAIEYYNIVNFTLTNATIPQRIRLYDLNISDSTDFQLTFTGSDFLPVENALVFVNRQYISEGVFKTVELPKTDSNGQTILHLVRNDIIYNIIITKDGVVLGTFENLIAFCEDFSIEDCTISLNALSEVTNIYDQDSNLGIIFTTPEYNETSRIISFDFISSDGTSKIVLMNVTRNDIFGNRSICDYTLASASGTLFCTVGANIDDSILRTKIYVNGEEITSTSTKLDKSNYGSAGYLVFLIMAISFILLFSSSKTGVLFAIGLSFLSAIGLGLITGSLIGLGAAGIWLILIIVVGIWKLNKERIQ